jgi:BMFP domain-containing protein YqiC
MPKENKFFEDLYKLAGSAMNTAFGTVADMKTQFDNMVDSKIDAILARRGTVTTEEFEVVRKMAQTAREKQDRLEEELAEIKKKLK